jgi:hypothetical protein
MYCIAGVRATEAETAMNDRNDVEAASRAFIASAFGMLKSEYVIPRPFYDAYIAVGRDYAGAGIMALLEYKRLEDQLKADYTSRFPEGIGTAAEYREYPSTYIFTLLEACVARSAQAENFDLPNAIVDPILIELRTMLEKSTFDVVCTRHVLHVVIASISVLSSSTRPRSSNASRSAWTEPDTEKAGH